MAPVKEKAQTATPLATPLATPFAQAVLDALKLIRTGERKKFNDARDEKLSGASYLREALKNARCDESALRDLRTKLEAAPEDFPNLRELYAGAWRVITATRPERGCANDPPRDNLQTLVGGDIEKLTLAMVDALMLGTTPLAVVALAVADAIEQCPDCFGVIESREEDARQAERVAGILKTADQLWRLDDVAWTIADEQRGLGILRFSWEGQATPVDAYPRAGSGARLLAWLQAK
jgi:hypothetical protein